MDPRVLQCDFDLDISLTEKSGVLCSTLMFWSFVALARVASPVGKNSAIAAKNRTTALDVIFFSVNRNNVHLCEIQAKTCGDSLISLLKVASPYLDKMVENQVPPTSSALPPY